MSAWTNAELIASVGADAEVGMRVRYQPSDGDEHKARWGANRDPRGVLDPEVTYKVERVEVHSWHTKLWLVGVEGRFNSVHFIPAPTPELSEAA